MTSYTREKLTYSLNAATFAIARGVKLLRIFREPGQKSTFVLDDGYDQATEALREYWEGEAMVNARTYAECRRYLVEEINASYPQPTYTTTRKENTQNAATASTAD